MKNVSIALFLLLTLACAPSIFAAYAVFCNLPDILAASDR